MLSPSTADFWKMDLGIDQAFLPALGFSVLFAIVGDRNRKSHLKKPPMKDNPAYNALRGT